jgi:hypothetical protein
VAGASLPSAPPALFGADPDNGEQACAEIFRRFVDPRFHTLLHFAGLEGEVIYPTAEHCQLSQPNGMSWSTPIEDGPFFGGIFLDGLCNRWIAKQDEESAAAAREIASGLMALADLSPTPGFVPRGIAADGVSFYPASSEDQVFPWFYGLWCYLRSDLPAEEECLRIEKKLRETVIALEGHQWQVPCATAEFGYRGSYIRSNAHDAARLLFLLRAMHRLTGEDKWLREYQHRLHEPLAGADGNRESICAAGLEFDAPPGKTSRIWTHSMSQAALRWLAENEEDAVISASFRRGLVASAGRAVPHLDRAKNCDRNSDLKFDEDWRFLNRFWKPQAVCDEAIALGRSQLPLWAEHNPRSPWEDDTMREPLFAAWMILLSNDDTLLTANRPRIQEMLDQYEWSGLFTASFFIAVNCSYESYRSTGLQMRKALEYRLSPEVIGSPVVPKGLNQW